MFFGVFYQIILFRMYPYPKIGSVLFNLQEKRFYFSLKKIFLKNHIKSIKANISNSMLQMRNPNDLYCKNVVWHTTFIKDLRKYLPL